MALNKNTNNMCRAFTAETVYLNRRVWFLQEYQTYKHLRGGALPVLQQRGHSQKLRPAGGNSLNAAPQGAVLPQTGRCGAPKRHLTHIQNIPD